MSFYEANYEFIKMKEVFKGDIEWEKAFALFHCLVLRDRATAEHSIEVAYYASKIAEKLNLDPSRYFLAGLLHDIGKISMNDHPLKTDAILNKKERKALNEHVLHGVMTLSELGFSRDIVQFCLRHHEEPGGAGYPFGVGEAHISIEGKIAHVADVFSALTSPRKYRTNSRVFSIDEALLLMSKEMETKSAFDYEVFQILTELVHGESFEMKIYA